MHSVNTIIYKYLFMKKIKILIKNRELFWYKNCTLFMEMNLPL